MERPGTKVGIACLVIALNNEYLTYKNVTGPDGPARPRRPEAALVSRGAGPWGHGGLEVVWFGRGEGRGVSD